MSVLVDTGILVRSSPSVNSVELTAFLRLIQILMGSSFGTTRSITPELLTVLSFE